MILKILHILSVIIALGANLTYGFLTYKAEREPAHLLFTLRMIQWIDKKVANRGYILVLITGLIMVWKNGYSITSLWIGLSLALFVLVAFMGIVFYSPVLKKQIQLVEQNQTNTPEYKKVKFKSTALGVSVTALVIIILVLMVMKPMEF